MLQYELTNRQSNAKFTSSRYDTRRYFNVRSKADISQLNLPHDAAAKKYRVLCRRAVNVNVNVNVEYKFMNKSVTGAHYSYSIKSYSLSHSWTLW